MPNADLAYQRMLRAEHLAAVDAAMAALAHDTRNALQRMQSCLTLMKIRGNEEVQVLVDEMQDAQDRLHELYEGFQSAIAPFQLERTEVDVRKLVERVWRQLRLRWSEKAIEWTVRLEQCDDTKADVDPQRLGDALRNVLETAIDASPRNGRIVCTFAHRDDGGRAFLEAAIEDRGSRVRDWGVGFAIAQRIVDEHDGAIGVGDGSEGGTSVVITLPRHSSE
jgi:signal transduction histidine kinase